MPTAEMARPTKGREADSLTTCDNAQESQWSKLAAAAGVSRHDLHMAAAAASSNVTQIERRASGYPPNLIALCHVPGLLDTGAPIC